MNKKKQKSISSKTRAITNSPPPGIGPLSESFSGKFFWVAVVLIIAAGTLAYSNSFEGAFVFDDKNDILENSSIRSLWPTWNDWQANLGRKRPIVNYSLAINYAISGYNVWSYHLLNLLIHVFAALTLFGIVHRTLSWGKFRKRYGQASTWLAFACALIWVVHPVHTQAVTYVIQRCESMMRLCFLLTLYFAIRGWQSIDDKYRTYWHLGAVTACLIGVGCKEVIAAAPVMVLLYDLIFAGQAPKQTLRRSWKLYAGLACCIVLLSAITIWATLIPNEFKVVGVGRIDQSGFNFVRSALVQTEVFFHYLHLGFWPNPLVFDYAWPFTITPGVYLYALGFLVLIIGSVWAMWRRHPLAYPVVWFVVILAPTSVLAGIGTLTPAAEHRLYLPLAGLVVLVVMSSYEGGLRLINRLSLFEQQRTWWLRVGAVSLVAVITGIFGSLTFLRNQDYQSEYTIWADTVQKKPQNAQALNNLGVVLKNLNRPQESISYIKEALKINPYYPSAHNNLGVLLDELGRPQEAIPHFQEALKLTPMDAEFHHNLGKALNNAGRLREAISHFQESLRIKPDEAKAYSDLGVSLTRLEKSEDAISYFKKALQLNPDLVEAYVNLGIALNQSARPQEAIPYFHKALTLQPNYAEAHNNLGVAMLKLKKTQKAIFHFQEALKFKPDLAASHANLGFVLTQSGQLEQAVIHYRTALGLHPNNPMIHYHLALTLLQQGKKEEAVSHFRATLKFEPNFIPAQRMLGQLAGKPATN